jgi:hypothetical protein
MSLSVYLKENNYVYISKMDTNYDYMKTLLPLPTHSVALHAMSGGAGNQNVDLSRNAFNNKSSSAEETSIAVAEPTITPTTTTLDIDGVTYYYSKDADGKIDLVGWAGFIQKYHLDLLESDEARRNFIESIMECGDINKPIQGNECDPLILNISALINAIVDKYKLPLDKEEQSNVDISSGTINKEELQKVLKQDYKDCPIKGDGWCLYRALIRGKAIIDGDNNKADCESNTWLAFENAKLQDNSQNGFFPILKDYIRNHLNDTFKLQYFLVEKTLQEHILEHINTITNDAEKQLFVNATADEDKINIFADNISAFKDNQFENGPIIWGFDLMAYIYSKANMINVNILQNCDDDTTNYCILAAYDISAVDAESKPANLLFDGINHYNLLVSSKPQMGGSQIRYKLKKRIAS